MYVHRSVLTTAKLSRLSVLLSQNQRHEHRIHPHPTSRRGLWKRREQGKQELTVKLSRSSSAASSPALRPRQASSDRSRGPTTATAHQGMIVMTSTHRQAHSPKTLDNHTTTVRPCSDVVKAFVSACIHTSRIHVPPLPPLSCFSTQSNTSLQEHPQ
ncbi:unnamed protein product [Ectocarpus sp. 8 AP-2014]